MKPGKKRLLMIVFLCLTKYLSWWWMPLALVEPKDQVFFIELYWSDFLCWAVIVLKVIVVVVDFIHFLINNHMIDTLWRIKLCFIRTFVKCFLYIVMYVLFLVINIHFCLLCMFNIFWCIFNILLYMFNILSKVKF